MNGALDFFEAALTNAALQKVKQAMTYLDAARAVDPSLTVSLEPVQILMTFAAKSTALEEIAKAEAGAPSLGVMSTDQLTLRAADSVSLVDGLTVASGGALTIEIEPSLATP